MKIHRYLLASAGAAVLGLAGAQAQSTDYSTAGSNANANIESLSRGAPALVFDNRLENTHGTPYALNRWLPGEVVPSNSGVRALQAPLKYDVFHQHLLVKANGKDSTIINPALISSFSLNDNSLGANRQRRFVRFADSPNPAYRQEFVEVLYERAGGYTLLKRYSKELTKANYQGAYSADQRYDELIDRPAYFLRRPDGTVAEVKLNRKSLAAAAPALQAGLAKRDIKTEQDAVLALQTVDTGK